MGRVALPANKFARNRISLFGRFKALATDRVLAVCPSGLRVKNKKGFEILKNKNESQTWLSFFVS